MRRSQQATWIVTVIVVLVIALIWGVGRAWSWGMCELYGHQTAREVRYAAFVGCLVKTGDHWVPRNELRTEQ